MQSLMEPIMNLHTAQLRACRNLVDTCITGIENINHLVLETTRELLCQQLTQFHAFAMLEDLQNAILLKDNCGQPDGGYPRLYFTALLQALSHSYFPATCGTADVRAGIETTYSGPAGKADSHSQCDHESACGTDLCQGNPRRQAMPRPSAHAVTVMANESGVGNAQSVKACKPVVQR